MLHPSLNVVTLAESWGTEVMMLVVIKRQSSRSQTALPNQLSLPLSTWCS